MQGFYLTRKNGEYYRLSINEDFAQRYPGKRLPYGFAPGEMIGGAALRQVGFVVPDAQKGFQAWQIYVKAC